MSHKIIVTFLDLALNVFLFRFYSSMKKLLLATHYDFKTHCWVMTHNLRTAASWHHRSVAYSPWIHIYITCWALKKCGCPGPPSEILSKLIWSRAHSWWFLKAPLWLHWVAYEGGSTWNLSADSVSQDLLVYLIKCGSLSPTTGLLNHNLWAWDPEINIFVSCYRLNCVAPNSICWSPNASRHVMVSGDRALER